MIVESVVSEGLFVRYGEEKFAIMKGAKYSIILSI